MKEADDLFSKAYELSVVEEKPDEAIELCERALAVDPDNYRVRVYLGMLLADHGKTANEKKRGHDQFIEALRRATDTRVVCDTWFEESAIHHLGVWNWNEGGHLSACLFFLTDFLTCHSQASYPYLIKLLREADPNSTIDIEFLMAKIGPKLS